jgi:hypothetical protein
VVVELGAERGLGVVEEDAPGAGESRRSVRYRFHVTAIAGGTRTIPVGTQVVFIVVPAQLGDFEAREVTPVTASTPR